MGCQVSRKDFEWTNSEEPHASRRKQILIAHPEIKQLFGHDPFFKYQVVSLVLIQVISLYFLRNVSWPWLIFVAYVFGGVINHALMLAVHEISHNLAFGYSQPLYNRLFGFIANFPIGVPMSISFKKYHLEHHRYQGDEIFDTDIPTELEAHLFKTTAGKMLWLVLQPFFYTLRPLVQNPKKPLRLEYVNLFVQFLFDTFVWYCFGGRMLTYLLIGSFLAMGLHPVAGHFISEHYMFAHGFETYSYYGPLNWVTFHVGYHNEHHDFPNIAGSRLHKVRKIAPEFYENLPKHTSWTKVLYDFVTDPSIGLYARMKRKHRCDFVMSKLN